MADQILLYSREEVARQLHILNILDPSFNKTVLIPGGWESWSSEWDFLGNGYAYYDDDGMHAHLVQDFANPIIQNTYYDVCFDVISHEQGAVSVYFGSTWVGTADSEGTHCFLYYSSSGSSMANDIRFVPENVSGWFEGKITNVQVRQNLDHLGEVTEITYEPYGLLDMYDDEPIGITYKFGDVSQLSKRFGAFSKNFRLPGTANNLKLLGHLHTNEAHPRIYDPRNVTKAVLLCDNTPALSGFLSLKNIVSIGEEHFYELELYDNSFGLIDEVKGKKLSDLDLTRLNHRLDWDSIRHSWTGTTWDNGGYYYPLYPALRRKPILPDYYVGEELVPAFYYRALLHEVFTQNGYSYTISDDINATANELLHCPIGARPPANNIDLVQESIHIRGTSSQVWEGTFLAPAQFASIPPAQLIQTVWEATNEVEDTSNNYNSTGYFFTAPYDGNYTFDLYASADLFVNSHQPAITAELDYVHSIDPHFRFAVVDLETDMVLLSTNQVNFPSSITGDGTAGHWTADGLFTVVTSVDLVAGQRVGMYGVVNNAAIYASTEGGTTNYRPTARMTLDYVDSHFKVTLTPNTFDVSEGMMIIARDWVGDHTQEQLLNDTIKLWNASFIPDPVNPKLIHISSRSALYNTTTTIDRSKKVDMESEIIKEYLTEVTSSELSLKYKESEDLFNAEYTDLTREEYGQHEFDFSTDIYNEPAEIRLDIYQPTPIFRDWRTRIVPGVDPNEKGTKLLVKSTEAVESNIRFKYYNTTDAVYEYAAETKYHPCLHTNGLGSLSDYDMNFGQVKKVLTNTNLLITANNLFAAHYEDQFQSYRDGRMFTVMMQLSIADVYEHVSNIGARIFISELNNWFVCLSIIDFDPRLGERAFTKVQLLEVGPSEKRIYRKFAYEALSTMGGSNNLLDRDSVFSVGSNNIGGIYNAAYGYYNYIGDNTSYVFITGENNIVDAGLSGVTIFGGTNIHATQSNTTYFGDSYVFGPSGASFFNNTNIGPTFTEFYGPSGVTIANTGITIGGVSITSSGFTIGGETMANTHVQDGSNTYTAGTSFAPTVNIVPNPIFESVSAHTFSAYTFHGDGQYLTGIPVVTGGTYSADSGSITFTNATGGSFSITGITSTDIYTTGGTFSAGTAIFRNNAGGTYSVSGFSSGDLTSWKKSVDEFTTEPGGWEPEGYRIAINSPAAGDFVGHDGEIAVMTSTGWEFEPIVDGDVVRITYGSLILYRDFSTWIPYDLNPQTPTLEEVLAEGEYTGAVQIILERPVNEVELTSSHNSPGTYVFNTFDMPRTRLLISANVTLDIDTLLGHSTWWWSLIGNATANISWASSKWSRPDGVTLPSSIVSGETYVMRVTELSGRAHIQSITKVVNV